MVLRLYYVRLRDKGSPVLILLEVTSPQSGVLKPKDHFRSNGTGIDLPTRLRQDADRVGRDIVLYR